MCVHVVVVGGVCLCATLVFLSCFSVLTVDVKSNVGLLMLGLVALQAVI